MAAAPSPSFMAFYFDHYSSIFLCISLLSLSLSSPSSSSSDVELLTTKIKPSLQGPSSSSDSLLLSTWNSSVPVCQWRGLKWVFSDGTPLPCSPSPSPSSPYWSNSSLYADPSLRLLSLQLPSANLSGSLPRELGEFSMLRSLYLGINSLSGTLPLELGYASSLSEVDLSDNLLGGVLPPSLWNLCDRLVSLRVRRNSLSGPLPGPALPNSTCRSLEVLDVGSNRFSGEFPEFVARFEGLKQIDLSSNQFSGSIPQSLATLRLDKLNLSNNNFTGKLLGFLGAKFGVDAFEENGPSLCGFPLRSCDGSSGMSSGTIAGLVIGLMTGAVVFASLLIDYLQNRKRRSGGGSEGDEFEECEDDKVEGGRNGEGYLGER